MSSIEELVIKFRKMSLSDNNLENNYVSNLPYSFSSAGRVQKFYPSFTRNQIHKKLTNLDTYSKFRKKRRSKTNPIFVHYPRQLFQVM